MRCRGSMPPTSPDAPCTSVPRRATWGCNGVRHGHAPARVTTDAIHHVSVSFCLGTAPTCASPPYPRSRFGPLHSHANLLSCFRFSCPSPAPVITPEPLSSAVMPCEQAGSLAPSVAWLLMMGRTPLPTLKASYASGNDFAISLVRNFSCPAAVYAG